MAGTNCFASAVVIGRNREIIIQCGHRVVRAPLIMNRQQRLLWGTTLLNVAVICHHASGQVSRPARSRQVVAESPSVVPNAT